MYEGVRQYCCATRIPTAWNCVMRDAANAWCVESVESSTAESLFESSLNLASSACTCSYSLLSFQTDGQSMVVLAPGAAPIAASMYSAGFSPGMYFGPPLRVK